MEHPLFVAVFGELVDTRRLTQHDAELRGQLRTAAYVRLNRTQFIARKHWDKLAPWQRKTVLAFATAASLNTGCVVGRTAGRLHGMWVLNLAEELCEVALPKGHTPAKSKRLEHTQYRRMTFRADEMTSAYGVPVPSLERTAVDIARFHGFHEGLIAADWLRSVAGVSGEELVEQVVSMGRFHHRKVALRAAQLAVPVSESPLESLLRAALIAEGVTGWQFQVEVGRYRVDFLFDAHVVVEVDGHSKHADRAHQSVMLERRRERELINAGFVFLRFDFEDLTRNMPWVLERIAEVRALRARRRR